MAWRTDPQGLMRRARSEFSAWLSRPSWNWYATHTFKADFVSPRQADKAWYAWFNSLRIAAKARDYTPSVYGDAAPFYFRCTEYQNRGTLHLTKVEDGDIRFSHNLERLFSGDLTTA